MARVTKASLLAAQLREFPGSVPLTKDDLRTYAYGAADYAVQEARFAWIGRCMLGVGDVVLFYRTASGHIGCRYGLEGSNYISNAPGRWNQPGPV